MKTLFDKTMKKFIVKIQTNFLKAIYEEKATLRFCKYDRYDEHENKIIFSINGCNLFIIPEELFFIDLNKIDTRHEMKSLIDFVNDKNAIPAQKTSELIMQDGNQKNLLVKIQGEDDTSIWISEKLLKEYEGTETYFKISENKMGCYLYNNNWDMIGYILKVKVK